MRIQGINTTAKTQCCESAPRNMDAWIAGVLSAPERQAMPIMTYPGLALTGSNVMDVISNGEKLFACMQALARTYPSLASLTLMDLSVEAEAFGCPIRYSNEDVPTVTAPIIENLESARNLAVPQVGAGRTGAYLEAARLAARQIKDRPVFGGLIGPLSLTVRLRDMNQVLLDLMIEPELIHAVLEKTTEFLTRYALAFKRAGANGVVIAEPAAGLLSAAHCDEFSSVYVRRIVEAVQDENFIVILHNCGRTVELVPSLVSTGARALHFGNAVDMKDILPQVPAGVLAMGNIDPAGVLRHGSPESVRQTTEALLEKAANYKNFVLSSGCDVPPGTPLDNIDAFYETLNQHNGVEEHAAAIG